MEKQQSKKPLIRFPEFKDAWEQKQFGEIFSFRVTNSLSRDKLNYVKGKVKNFHYGDIHTKFSTLFDITKEKVPYINSDIELKRIAEENYCKVGDLIITDASEDYEGVGKSIEIVNLNSEPILAGLHTILARPDKVKVGLGFFGYYFKNENFRIHLKTIAQGSKVLSISSKRLAEVEIIIPPTLSEQKRIASFFTVLDKKIAELKQKKNLLEQYKKGVMQKLFSQVLRFKDDNGKEFPKWEKKKLGKVAEINPRSEKLPETFIYIDLESVVQGRLTKEDRINKSEAPSRAQRLLIKNDILFQMVRPYQKNNYFFDRNEKDFVASTGYAQIRTTGNAEFLFQFLHEETFVRKVIEKCTGTGYPAINSTDLSNIIISIPSEKEQNKIANFLAIIDDKINRTENQLQQTQQYKKGLLQNMFI